MAEATSLVLHETNPPQRRAGQAGTFARAKQLKELVSAVFQPSDGARSGTCRLSFERAANPGLDDTLKDVNDIMIVCHYQVVRA